MKYVNLNYNYLSKRLNQISNYDKNTLNFLFGKIKNRLNIVSNNDLACLFSLYNNQLNVSSIQSSIKIKNKHKHLCLVYKFKELNKYIKERLYKSDILMIDELKLNAFSLFILFNYLIFFNIKFQINKQLLDIILLSIGAYFITRLLFNQNTNDNKKICMKVKDITLFFIDFALFGLVQEQYIILFTIRTVSYIILKIKSYF